MKKNMKINLSTKEMRILKKKKLSNENLGQIPIYHSIKQTKLDELLWDFEAVSCI